MAQTFTRGQVCAASGIKPYSLTYWQHAVPAIRPSVLPANGKGSVALWSSIDGAAIVAIGQVHRDLQGMGATMPSDLVADIWQRVHEDEWPVTVTYGTLTITTPQPGTSIVFPGPAPKVKGKPVDVARLQPMCEALDQHRPELVAAMQAIVGMLNEEPAA